LFFSPRHEFCSIFGKIGGVLGAKGGQEKEKKKKGEGGGGGGGGGGGSAAATSGGKVQGEDSGQKNARFK